MYELTEEAGLAEVHIHALQTSVAVPRCHPFTAVTGDHNIEQVTVACNEHVHLWIGRGQLLVHSIIVIKLFYLCFANLDPSSIIYLEIFTYLQLVKLHHTQTALKTEGFFGSYYDRK